ncbi:MAG: tyrosine-protein phosphatase [bacterium]|nr:tyrosine-protein phosphatase [bacterium]
MTNPLIEGARNFRDVGGYATNDGRVVRSGLVFRSAHLADLTDRDLETFADIGIKTIIDYRPEVEKEMTGHDRVPPGVRHRTITIGDPTLAPEVHRAMQLGDFSALHDLEEGNRMLIREYAAELGQALRLISDADNLPLVFHCIGGKDRTGMTSLLLLALLGVGIDQIRTDYLKSNDAVAPTAEAQEAFFSSLVKRTGHNGELSNEQRHALQRFFILDESYFAAAWDEIHEVAGSLDRYVADHLGLSDDEVASLHDLLLVSAD